MSTADAASVPVVQRNFLAIVVSNHARSLSVENRRAIGTRQIHRECLIRLALAIASPRDNETVGTMKGGSRKSVMRPRLPLPPGTACGPQEEQLFPRPVSAAQEPAGPQKGDSRGCWLHAHGHYMLRDGVEFDDLGDQFFVHRDRHVWPTGSSNGFVTSVSGWR